MITKIPKRKVLNSVSLFSTLIFILVFTSCRKQYFKWSLPEKAKLGVSILEILNNSVKLQGEIFSNNFGEVNEISFSITSGNDFSQADIYKVDFNESKIYNLTLNNLDYATNYKAKFILISEAGYSESEIVEFSTPNIPGSSTIILTNYSNISYNSVTVEANVSNQGNSPVVSRGFCWSTTPQPTTSDSYSTNGGGIGPFSFSISGLTNSTTYYIRAYATNQAGTSYSNQLEINTLNGTATIDLTNYSNISYNSIDVEANISNQGNSPVVSRGFCWSTSPLPTVSDSYSTNGSGIGAFNYSINGLAMSTTYYIRAYATNQVGTTYSNQIQINTDALQFGDIYQGGHFFYLFQPGDQGYIEGEVHGLVASTLDLSNASWGCSGLNVSTLPDVGSGNANTINIVTQCAQTNNAGSICSNLVLNGFSDWYLPSFEELQLLRQNLWINGIGNFQNNWYWSSHQFSASSAACVNFNLSGTSIGNTLKDYTYHVRAIRNF